VQPIPTQVQLIAFYCLVAYIHVNGRGTVAFAWL